MARKATESYEDALPPHSAEAEAALLSCCLQDEKGEVVGELVERIGQATVFYDLRHQTVWKAIAELYQQRKPMDLVLLNQALAFTGQLEGIGGAAFLMDLMSKAPGPSAWQAYWDLVYGKWRLRRMLAALTQSAQELYEVKEEEVTEFLAEIEHRVMAAGQDAAGTACCRSMKELVLEVGERYIDKFKRGRKMSDGIMMGFNYLDNIVPGMAPAEYVVIGARPGLGKTALMMQIAEYVAVTCRKAVGIFSMEMTGEALAMRAMFQRAGACLYKFRNGFAIETEMDGVVKAAAKLAAAPIYIDDTGRMSVEELEVRARRMVRLYGVQLFAVDYIQLLHSRKQREWGTRNEEMGEISLRIKALAKELQVPFVVAAQLNREVEKEPTRKPRLADLRDCGQIEQDADIVGLLYAARIKEGDPKVRMDWLERMPGPVYWRNEWRKYFMRVNLLVAKQKNGPLGDVPLVFIKEWIRFVDAWRPAEGEEAGQTTEEQELIGGGTSGEDAGRGTRDACATQEEMAEVMSE